MPVAWAKNESGYLIPLETPMMLDLGRGLGANFPGFMSLVGSSVWTSTVEGLLLFWHRGLANESLPQGTTIFTGDHPSPFVRGGLGWSTNQY